MKLKFLNAASRRVLGIVATAAVFAGSSAQAVTFDLSFAGGTNVAGGGACTTTLLAQCRFANVVQGAGTGFYQRDAINTFQRGGGRGGNVATLGSPFDNDAVTYTDINGAAIPGARLETFAPTVVQPNIPNGNSWVEFTVELYAPGTNTLSALPGVFHITSFDTDGSATGGTDTTRLREFIEYIGAAQTGLATGTKEILGTAVDGGTNYVVSASNLGVNGITNDPQFKASALYNNVSSFKFAVGGVQGTGGNGGAGNRLSTYSFQITDSVVFASNVDGYKSVALTTDANSDGVVSTGDTLTYTVSYANTGNAPVSNFQIADTLPAGLSAAVGAQTVTGATKNAAYNGGSSANLLATGQTLAAGSSVTVSIPVTVGTVADNATVLNQAVATVGGASINSDNVDSTTFFPASVAAAGVSVPPNSITQTQAATVDKTSVLVRASPQITLNKTVASRVNAADQFTVQIKSASTVTASANTSGTGTAASTGAQTLTSGVTSTLTEVMAAGSVSSLSAYTTSLTCTNVTASTTSLPSGSGQSFSITPKFGDVITCTLTNTAIPTYSVSGQVYEDTNYGGGAGRAYTAGQGMSLRPSVRVELYNSTGVYIASAFTDSNGAYTFPGQLSGTYKVRVVNSFVTSSRTGGCTAAVNVTTPPASCTQLPVQTYVYGAGQVGGAAPAGVDPALSAATLPTGAESVASVTVSTTSVAGVDFGFNFDTVVNVNDSGQGSLRQFVTNSNALGNTALAQIGQTAGKEVSIFMIPSAALTSGVAIINLTSSLIVTDTDTSIDSATQTTYIGDTNTGSLGTGGAVGVDGLTLDQVSKPEVEITLPGSSTLQISAANFILRSVALHGGNQLVLGTGAIAADNALIEKNIFGTTATAFSLPASLPSAQYGIYFVNASGTVRNNLIGYSANSGINYLGGGANLTLQNNEFQQSGYVSAGGDAITLTGSTTAGFAKPVTITGNLIANSNSSGVQFEIGSVANNTVTNNTITGNGTGGAATRLEGSGIHYLARNSGVNATNSDTISKNMIFSNQKSGIVINFGQQNVTISRNSFYTNGLTSIDFTASDGYVGGNANYGQGNGVTPNDGATVAREGNTGQDYPVFAGVYTNGTSLNVSGFVGNGVSSIFDGKSAIIELYKADDDGNQNGPVIVGDAKSVPHGEGKTYLGTLTVTLGTKGAFSGAVTVAAGAFTGNAALTATVTVAGNTSEFSPNIQQQAPVISLLKLGRIVTPALGAPSGHVATTFTDSDTTKGRAAISVLPKDVIEYCIVYNNTGGQAPNFKLTDNVPAGMDTVPDAYSTGKGIRSSATSAAVGGAAAPTGTDFTNASGDDLGTLSASGGTNSTGLLTFDLGSAGLAAGGSGTVCFQTKVK